jgi:ribonuclease D
VQTTASKDVHGVSLVARDISDSLVDAAFSSLAVAMDIETTGLDWKKDRIASVQVAVPDGPIEIVRLDHDADVPANILALLGSRQVLKVFHHAMFDLRFIISRWDVLPQRIACTKVASKVIDPSGDVGHGLVDLARYYLGIEIDKSEQTSNWLSATLTPKQIAYAANDVRYLLPLLYALLSDLRQKGLEQLALHCFDHLPTRVELEVRELGDVFTY